MDSSLFTHRSHALRCGRFSETGRAYLLTAITYKRQPVFNDWRLARLLIAEMRRLHDAKLIESCAWVVMPDHLHWLVQLGPLALPTLMQQLKSRSAIAINKACPDHQGQLWQKGFHDHALRHASDCTLHRGQPTARRAEPAYRRLPFVGCHMAVGASL